MKIPPGLDLRFGYRRYKQEYVSGTLKAFQNIADISLITGEPSDTQLSDGGNGKLERDENEIIWIIRWLDQIAQAME